tara:strand:- start:5590 stop:6063 length:474 start_codon:yes stop_codon:yes gene_type:complete
MIENMKAFMESKSINNENTPFVQVRHDAGGNMMHLQVCSLLVKGNRDYGYADKFSVPPVVADSIRAYTETEGFLFDSLASDSKVYIREPFVKFLKWDDGVQMVINSRWCGYDKHFNHADGFVLDMPVERFGELILHLDAVGMLTTMKGKRIIGGEEE